MVMGAEQSGYLEGQLLIAMPQMTGQLIQHQHAAGLLGLAQEQSGDDPDCQNHREAAPADVGSFQTLDPFFSKRES